MRSAARGSGAGPRPPGRRSAPCRPRAWRRPRRRCDRNAAKSSCRGYADQPPMITFGRLLERLLADDVHVDQERLAGPRRTRRPRRACREKLIFMPCVRWPPCASSRPRILSPALIRACSTAALAVAPECGWTLACSAPNSALARVDRDVLRDVDLLAAAVVAAAGVALGVLVGEHGALRLQHGARDEVLAARSSRACPAGGRAHRRGRRRSRGPARRGVLIHRRGVVGAHGTPSAVSVARASGAGRHSCVVTGGPGVRPVVCCCAAPRW